MVILLDTRPLLYGNEAEKWLNPFQAAQRLLDLGCDPDHIDWFSYAVRRGERNCILFDDGGEVLLESKLRGNNRESEHLFCRM